MLDLKKYSGQALCASSSVFFATLVFSSPMSMGKGEAAVSSLVCYLLSQVLKDQNKEQFMGVLATDTALTLTASVLFAATFVYSTFPSSRPHFLQYVINTIGLNVGAAAPFQMLARLTWARNVNPLS